MTILFLLWLATAQPSDVYTSWVKSGEVHIRYSGGGQRGPLKVYARGDVFPAGGGCPDGPAPMWTVRPEYIYQHWPPGAKAVEYVFSDQLVGDLKQFAFTAVTVTADSEYCLVQGFVPHGK
jgi:hypothetical protein